MAHVKDFDRRRSDADHYSSSARTRKDSDEFSEPVECELARSGRHMVAKQTNADHVHSRYCSSGDLQDYDRDHTVTDLDDIRVEWGWSDSSHDDIHDERLTSGDYDQQLRTHGWRMEVHGDPLNLKCVACCSGRVYWRGSTESDSRPS